MRLQTQQQPRQEQSSQPPPPLEDPGWEQNKALMMCVVCVLQGGEWIIPGQQSLQNSRATALYYGEGRRYVKLLEFSPDIEFHVVYLGVELFVLSSQISCLFWEDDCLAYMVSEHIPYLPFLLSAYMVSEHTPYLPTPFLLSAYMVSEHTPYLPTPLSAYMASEHIPYLPLLLSAYMASEHIPYLPTPLSAYMLQQENLVMHKVIVSRQQQPALFEELAQRDAFFEDEDERLLNLYLLENVPMLLDVFGDKSQKAENLKVFIRSFLSTFDPDDPYWRGADEDGLSCGASESTSTGEDADAEPEDTLTLEELQLALHSMQINRKRILRRMTSEPECMAEVVQELESTEDSIMQIQELIHALHHNHTTDLKLSGSGKPRPPSADCAKTVAPQPKALASSSVVERRGPETRGAVKTNVVTPMVQPPHPPPQPPSGSNLPLTDLLPESLELMAANQQLAEEIRQKDQIISSMLGGVGGSSLPMPAAGRGGPLPWMGPTGLHNFPPPVGGHSQNPGIVPGAVQASQNPNLVPLSHNRAPFLPNPTGIEGSRFASMFPMSSQPQAQNPLLQKTNPPPPLPMHIPGQSQLRMDNFLPGQEGRDHSQAPSDKDSGFPHKVGLETASLDHIQTQQESGFPSQSAVSSKFDLPPLPAVNVVQPHPAFHMAFHPGIYPPAGPFPASQVPPSTTQPPPRPTLGPLSAPAPYRGQGDVPSAWSNPASLNQQFVQLQQRQMALYQQQAMFRPRLTTPLLFPNPPPSSPRPLLPPAVGGGGSQLLPGMMPLLQSFQDSCSVRPSSSAAAAPPPESSAAVPRSQ
ncbi:hypothetical protein ACOMHN_016667 [Nucella lapillus]